MEYRTEIDGLRALAVIAVIIFHIDEALLAGGYLGVDVFFVISGFLITTIVATQIEEGKFSIKSFLGRRFVRLYPAMLTMVAVTMLVGSLLLMQPERGSLVMQGVASIFSFQNIWIWKTTGGYWDSSTEYISLLHTWSLSLEEQFYIFFPLILLLGYKLGRKYIKVGLILGICLSILACLAASILSQNAAFYLLPTRMWELLIGALLAISLKNRKETIGNDFYASGGLILIIISFLFIDSERNLYGLISIVSCVGTVFILKYANDGFIHSVLSFSPLTYIGKISYSLYLWHWPIIVYMKYIDPEYNKLLAIILILAFSLLSYYLIENNFRHKWRNRKLLLIAPIAACALCFLPLIIIKTNPFITDYGNIESKESLTRGHRYEATENILQNKVWEGGDINSEYSIGLFGSSHARVLGTAVEEYCKNIGWRLYSFATSGVFVSCDNSDWQPNQDEIRSKRIQLVSGSHPDVILYAERWEKEVKSSSFEEDLKNSLNKLIEGGALVIVMGQVPKVDQPEQYKGSLRNYILSKSLLNPNDKIKYDKSVIEANNEVRAIIESLGDERVEFIDVHAFNTKSEEINLVVKGQFIYADDNHLNDIGSKHLFEQMLQSKITSVVEEVSKKYK